MFKQKDIASLQGTVWLVAGLNLAYFGVEFGVARAIGSVSLFADSIDFLEDAAINILIGLALTAGAVTRARLGKGLALIILLPAIATLWTAWTKVQAPDPPAPLLLSLTGIGALLVNLTCALLLTRYRGTGAVSREPPSFRPGMTPWLTSPSSPPVW